MFEGSKDASTRKKSLPKVVNTLKPDALEKRTILILYKGEA